MVIALISLLGSNSVGGSYKMFPEGVRLNNPGNIRHSHDKWHGEARLQDNKKFVRFLTPQAGIRAMMKILITYEDVYRITTISSIIMRWAPPAENNTQAYIDDVSIRMGFPPNMMLNIHDPDTLISLSQAIVMHENGHSHGNMPIYWYEEVVYHEAAMSALAEEAE
jgi:hypothetical protein